MRFKETLSGTEEKFEFIKAHFSSIFAGGALNKILLFFIIPISSCNKLKKASFLLIDKAVKEIISAYSASDHPAYGNGGNFEKLPHPFGAYDETKYEIILIDNETIAELKAQVTQEKSLLTLVNEDYKPNMAEEEVYKPLHSGKFLDKEPELVQTIPAYIRVRKLQRLTQVEKLEKENKKQRIKQKSEQDIIRKRQNKISVEDKLKALGLTQEEIEALNGRTI